MNRLRKSLCFLFSFLILFTMVGCDKNNNDDSENTENNNPPVSQAVTTTEVLGRVFDKVNQSLTEPNLDGNSFENDEGYSFYNEFVYAGLSVLKELSSYSNLEEEKVLSSNSFNLTMEENCANKVEKFYIKNRKNHEENRIELYILSSRKKHYEDNNLDSILFYYDIYYNEKNNNCTLTCKIEKSRAKENESEALYNIITFTDIDDEHDFQAKSFFRNDTIDLNNKNLLSANLISKIQSYKIIDYDLILKLKFTYEENSEIQITDKTVQNNIVDELESFSEIRETISSKEIELENQECFTSKLLRIINATRIIDFEP